MTEISITRVPEHIYLERQAYWKTGKRNEGSDTWQIDSERSSLEDQVKNMQVEICLHDFIPGVTQFIAFD